MGKIIRNGIEFSSTVDTANNISYDNSLSGLEATTTQKAIDEVAESLGGFEFYIDEQGKAYYKPMGADSGIPFKSGITIEEFIDTYLNKTGITRMIIPSLFLAGKTITVSRGATGDGIYIRGQMDSDQTPPNWNIAASGDGSFSFSVADTPQYDFYEIYIYGGVNSSITVTDN